MSSFIQITLISDDETVEDVFRSKSINTACIAEVGVNHDYKTIIVTTDGFKYLVEEGYSKLLEALDVKTIR